MADSSLPRTSAAESLQIHLAVCRYRRQGLVCATCHELTERAARYARFIREAA